MTDQEFQSEENANLRDLIALLEKYCSEIELVSYGLAPNPNGFCYEKFSDIPDEDELKLDKLLITLSDNQEEEIKKLYLR